MTTAEQLCPPCAARQDAHQGGTPGVDYLCPACRDEWSLPASRPRPLAYEAAAALFGVAVVLAVAPLVRPNLEAMPGGWAAFVCLFLAMGVVFSVNAGTLWLWRRIEAGA